MDGRATVQGETFAEACERSSFNRQMAAGHKTRTGHKLTGYYVNVPGVDGVTKLVRTCCSPVDRYDSGNPRVD